MKRRRKVNRPMMAAGIMLCLALLSACLGSGIYARYTVRATAGENSRVAKFEVSIDFVTPQAEGDVTAQPAEGSAEAAEAPKPGELTAENNGAQIVITNNSETAVRVKLRIEFSSDAKDYMKAITLKKGETSVSGAWKTNSETVYEFPKVVDLAPGATATYDLTMEQDPAANPSETADAGWKNFSNTDTDSESGTINYVIIAGYTQID